jgi:hypothetical protein
MQATPPTSRARSLRAKDGVRVRIAFTLPRRQKLQVTLRGPAPSCETVGTMPFAGARGDNRLDFRGRIRGKAVQPGVYILTLTNSAGQPVVRPLRVQVVSPRRTILLDNDAPAGSATCGPGQASSVNGPRGNESGGVTLITTPFDARSPRKPPAPTRGGSGADEGATPRTQPPAVVPQPPQNDVLGIDLPALPEPPPLPEEGPWLLAVFLMLALVGLPLLAVVVLARRLLRGRGAPEPS